MDSAQGTLAREDKGRIAPPPAPGGVVQVVADAVAAWPGVTATTHWYLFDQNRVDGIDFYVGAEELGHVHLGGELHLATSPDLGRDLIGEGLAKPFRYQKGWVCEDVSRIGAEAAIALFRRNYDRLAEAQLIVS